MSFNVGHIEILTWEGVKMLKRDLRRFAKGDHAESSFLYEHADCDADADGFVEIDREKFWWSGEGSGSSWEHFIKKIAPKIRGTIEAVVTWEDGDSHTGLRIVDGKVTEPDVVMALAPEAT